MRYSQPSQRILRQVQFIVVSLSLILSQISPAFAANASAQVASPALNASNFVPASHFASVTTMLLKLRAWWQGGSNLDTMRNSSPSLPNSYQQIGSLPPAGYDDPKPSNTANYDSYLTQLAARGNATGVAGGLPMQASDPTAGSAVVGGWSYNLDSGNYNFMLPALGLAGRAGLGVSLGLSYNSKVWTKDPATNTMVFNGDRGFPAPGWNIGFGAIQIKDLTGGYYNGGTGASSIIYIAPDGNRHDMANVPGTASFKTYDSSYIVFDAAAQVMHFPNGTKVKYGAYSYDTNVRDYHALPIQVTDRNGNYVTITYKDLTTSAGTKKVIDSVTDTAGRRIDFNYQNNLLTSVSQDRGGNVFYYVRLDYVPVTIKTRFVAPLTADPGNINNTDVYFPIRITYPTGISYRFSYTSYGQINTFQKWVPGISGQGDERPVAQTALVGVAHCIDLNAPENSQNYCNPIADLPRFFQRQEKAEGWMGATAGNWATAPFQTYQYYGTDIYDPTGRRFLVQTNGPTQTVSIFAPNAGSFTKKDEATYTSDSGVGYLSNLRVTETKSTAVTNGVPQIKTTQFTYLQRDGMWLPATKSENGGYRLTVMEYTSYPAQYILGLPQQVSVYGAPGLMTRVSNNYDETGSFTDSNGQNAPYFIDATSDNAIQRDNTNYGSSFTARGNLTSVTQYSVVGGSINGSRVTKRVSYDTNGNVRAETDAAGNRKQIEYTDNYLNKPANIGVTCAYPYTTADPTGFRAGAQWNYFTGQTIKSFNLLAGSSSEQQVVTTSYDFADRPSQTNRPDSGWVKTSYWDNWLAGVTSQQVDAGQVRYKFELSDGAGRATMKASDHPDGVSGRYAGQITVYDIVGQVTDSSNVLAVDGSWITTAEDQGKQFLYTHLTRDELSRLKLVTLPDNNTRQYDYTGCGCAGNSETRLSDELGHQTITKTDALSRLVEATEPNTSASDGIYSKATYIYDSLDRLVEIQHRGGYNPNTGAVPTQFRYFSYDGYGRLASESTPEGGIVTYSYTANDQVATRSDGRGISSAYVYNNRSLPASVSYSDGTPQVVYNYDAYGARSSVTDGEGATSYSYNNYRQLQSETRTFTGLANQSFTLGYTYNQADQVRSVHHVNTFQNVTGPDVSVSDKGSAAGPFSLGGQITNQQGQPQSQVTVQLWNMGIHPVATVTTDTNGQYSFGNLTAGGNYTVRPVATSGTVFTPGGRIYANLRRDWTSVNFTALPATLTTYDKTVNYAYNSVGALAGVGTNLIGSDANNTTNVLNTVSFRANGALRQLHYGNERRLTMGYNDNRSQPISMKVDRVNNPADKIIDNSYEYYMTDPETGASVNNNRIRRIVDNTGYGGDTADYYYDQYNRLTNVQGTGYFRYYLYDPWGNIKNFSAVTLNYQTNATGAPATNRISSDGVGFNYSYDEAGNMTVGMGQTFGYDGANRMKTASYGNSTYGYDGDGMRVKKTENGTTTYYVQSSALKNTAMEVTSAGVLRAYVHAGGKLTAMQATDGQFYWLHTNHLGNSRAMTDVNGNLTYKGQFDPYGQTVSEWSSSGNNNLNTKKFTGYERDVATGLDYASARMYNSGRGRFMTPDPIGVKGANFNLPQSLNQYAYVENDPINFIDPSGKLRAYSVGLCTLASITSIMDGGGASWFMSCPSIGNGNDDDIGGIGAGGSYVLGLDDSSKLRDQANDFFKDKPGCKDFINNAAKGLGVPELDSVLSKIKFIDTTVYGAPLNERMSKLGFGSQFGNKKLSEVMVTDTDRPKALANPYFGNSYYGTIFFSDKHFGDSLPMQQRTAAHEVLHVVFRGDHEKIVKSLGLTAFPADYNNDELSTLVNQFLDANCDLNKLPPHKQE